MFLGLESDVVLKYGVQEGSSVILLVLWRGEVAFRFFLSPASIMDAQDS